MTSRVLGCPFVETLLVVGLGVLTLVLIAVKHRAITRSARESKGPRLPWYVTAMLLIALLALMVFTLSN